LSLSSYETASNQSLFTFLTSSCYDSTGGEGGSYLNFIIVVLLKVFSQEFSDFFGLRLF